jgi:hypothetical protein
MCQRVTCSSCGKPTYAGCGRHVEAVLGDVPKADRCQCREKQAAPLGDAEPSGWFRSWFGTQKGRQP